MTKLLEQVLEELRKRPQEEQDEAAALLESFLESRAEPEEMDEDTRAAIEEGLAQIERGEVVSEEEMAEFFRSLGA